MSQFNNFSHRQSLKEIRTFFDSFIENQEDIYYSLLQKNFIRSNLEETLVFRLDGFTNLLIENKYDIIKINDYILEIINNKFSQWKIKNVLLVGFFDFYTENNSNSHWSTHMGLKLIGQHFSYENNTWSKVSKYNLDLENKYKCLGEIIEVPVLDVSVWDLSWEYEVISSINNIHTKGAMTFDPATGQYTMNVILQPVVSQINVNISINAP